MLIDWLTLRLPLAKAPHVARHVDGCLGRFQRANADGLIVDDRPYLDIDALRSDTVGVMWQVNNCPEQGRMLVVGASPAQLEHGCNVFGSCDIKHCAKVLLSHVSEGIGLWLPNLEYWQCRRIDVTENYAFDSEDQVKEALRALRGSDAPRTRAFIMGGDTVGWNKGSDRRAGKAYHKGPQLQKLYRKGVVKLTDEQIELAHKLLRLELKIGSRWFREEYFGKWQDLTESQLAEMHGQYFGQFFGSAEVTEMGDNGLKEALRGLIDSKGLCCTNQSEGAIPLTPDGLMSRARFEAFRAE